MQPVCVQGQSAFSPPLSKLLHVCSSSSTTVCQACGGSAHQTVCHPICRDEDEECREEEGIRDRGEGDWEQW